jgi:hypothetical protein
MGLEMAELTLKTACTNVEKVRPRVASVVKLMSSSDLVGHGLVVIRRQNMMQ